MTWLLIGCYAAGYVWCFRFVVGTLLADWPDPDLEDVSLALLGGVMFTLFWPLLVAGRLAQRWYYAHDQRSLSFFRPLRPIESPSDRADRLERERDDRDRRIAALERELGIARQKP